MKCILHNNTPFPLDPCCDKLVFTQTILTSEYKQSVHAKFYICSAKSVSLCLSSVDDHFQIRPEQTEY